MESIKKYLLLLSLPIILSCCLRKYEPPAIQATNSYLVVDGFINANTNEASSFVLSRSRNLLDTITNIPELNAKVSIISNTGNIYTLTDPTNKGNYSSIQLNLNLNNQYQLKITTSNGNQYISDLVPIKQSPVIDSLSWQQDSSLTVYLNAHDPNNNTHYYKWDFIETWENHAPVQTFWVQNNGLISFADSTSQTDSCWTTSNSKNIILGNSISLSQDVISRAPLTTILQNDIKLKVKYSILARQIPLTADAYNYWLLIQKNSQQLGTLFDPQPSQLNGNIHPLTNPNETVIGYITAASTQQKRIFIRYDELTNWSNQINYNACDTKVIPTDPLNNFIYTYADTSYAPWYFTGLLPNLIISKKACVDCREYGGNNVRPSFWQ